MKQKRFTLLLALALLMVSLCSCASHDMQEDHSVDQTAPPPNVLEIETLQPTNSMKPIELAHFDSELGCSASYDPIFFIAEDVVEEYPQAVVSFSIHSIEEIDGFPVYVHITPLDARSVEEAVSDMMVSRNLDDFMEEATFGANHYAATHLTYYDAYAVGDIYVTEQDGSVFSVEISSYHQPSASLLARAYAILDSLTF